MRRRRQIQRGEKNTNEKNTTENRECRVSAFRAVVSWMKGLRFPDGVFFFLALIVFAADQLSKFWVTRRFTPGETFPLIPDIFHITYVRNPGAAFGIFADYTPVFIAVSLLMVVIIIMGGRFLSARYFLLRLALALQLGGALGNLSDRIRTGFVTDFLDFRFWPVFNLADIALVMGIVLLIFSLLIYNSFFYDEKA